ncbi:MAG: hypothetical protein IIY93_02840 [Clostridia bacterium]|nr:hypothetical protein [Clostridia bacterium]MBQ4396959.1 hypothetical protein [Clostridia bacterium]
MDNIGEMLQSVLGNPEAMAKLKETARQLGINPDADMPPPSPSPAASAPPKETASPTELAASLGQLVPLLGKIGQDDDMSRLIHALKPFLSGSRLKKAEEADKIMMLLRLIPLLQNLRQTDSSQ